VPVLAPLWARHASRRLVEPFCGGLAVALGLNPDHALLNDANPHLINFYVWLKRGLEIDVVMENDEALFYRHRDRFNLLVRGGRADTREAASLFYFLNRTGYNGLCRFSKQGDFNVPFGRYSRIRYARRFAGFRDAAAHWTFTSEDFAAVPLSRSDFVYADPPYDVEFRQYASGGFSWEDQVRLAEHLRNHPGPVVLVNQATRRIARLYRQLGYSVRRLEAPRRINSTGDRTPAKEVIATRNI
jgi:DNA adenine methylase